MMRLQCLPLVLTLAAASPLLAQQPAAPPQVPAQPPPPGDEHAGHQADQPAPAPEQDPPPRPPFIPPLTDADRAAAFPPLRGHHHTSDNAVRAMVLFDQLEWQAFGNTNDLSWDTTTWIGTDTDRLWFRAEGDRARGRFEQAQLQALYGRAISRWWQLMAGVRQDIRPGAPRTAAAIGVQGLAPYFFHVEGSLFAEANGRAHLRLETEYDLLVTNRVVLQPLVEVEIYSRADPAQQLGRGLATLDAGLRLRYEVRREFAPYLGLVWHRAFFDTADLHRAAGRRDRGVAVAFGVRLWR